MKFRSLEEAAEAGFELVERNALVYTIKRALQKRDIYHRHFEVFSVWFDGSHYRFEGCHATHGWTRAFVEFFYSEVL